MAALDSTMTASGRLFACVRLTDRNPWRSGTLPGGERFHAAGDHAEARRLADAIAAADDADAIAAVLSDQRGHFGLIVEATRFTVAAVDACRTQAIFYAPGVDCPIVSNDAYTARDEAGLSAFDPATVLEFAMAGFVTGGETVVRDLRQIEAGSFLLFDAAVAPAPRRYFTYLPEAAEQGREIDWPQRLRDALDAAFAEIVARTAGRPVLVPISGGFDSRLVLCKLHEHGCRDLTAFSYGTPGNTDAAAGRAVAEALGVPWRFVPSSGARARRFFASADRRDYWRFADNLSTIPNFQDLQALQDLRAAGALHKDTVVINGQTGDFLSGGHILKTVRDGTTGETALTKALFAKHFSLWRRLDSPANRMTVVHRMHHQMAAVFPDLATDAPLEWPDVMALCQYWEFNERQAKYVINGQRIYEYFGLGWELPLWNFGLIRLFRDAPAELKLGQRLYIQVLREWNYKGLFANHHRPVNSWPAGMRFMAPVEAGVRRLFGAEAHRLFNRYARYFGHYRHQYSEMTLPVFLRTAADARNLLSLHGRTWLAERGVIPSPFDQTDP